MKPYKIMSDSSRIAFLFPGQGSQSVGMGKELFDNHAVARRTFEEADEALGYKLSQLCFEGPEEKLKLTEITQPAILTASVAEPNTSPLNFLPSVVTTSTREASSTMWWLVKIPPFESNIIPEPNPRKGIVSK